MTEAGERIRLAPEDAPLLAAVVLLPWAFGGVELWAYRTASALLALAAAIALVRSGPDGWGLGHPRSSRWLLPAFLLLIWGVVQLVPVPAGFVRVLSPEAHRIYTDSIPRYAGAPAGAPIAGIEQLALREVPEADGIPAPASAGTLELDADLGCFESSWHSLSLQPTATSERVFWYGSLLAAFFVVRRRVSDPSVYRFYRSALFILFAALTLFGFLQQQNWNGMLYGVRPMTTVKPVFGPYINPTNFAWLMELSVPWMTGYALSLYRRHGRAALRHARFGLAVLGVCLGLVAAVSAASKGAIVLIGAGLLALAVISVEGRRWRAWTLAAGLALAVASPLLLSQTKLGERFEEYTTRISGAEIGEGRFSTMKAALRMIGDYPLTGVGFGAFREVFPRYMPAGSVRWWDQAHNDWLELATDGGLIALGLVGWLGWGFASRSARRLREGVRRISPCRFGLACGIVAMTVHGFFDFNHQIPANALVFVTACAMLLPVVGREPELVEDP